MPDSTRQQGGAVPLQVSNGFKYSHRPAPSTVQSAPVNAGPQAAKKPVDELYENALAFTLQVLVQR